MNKLTGLKIKLDRPVDRERACCLNVCTIGRSTRATCRRAYLRQLRPAPWLAQQTHRAMDRTRRDALRCADDADRRARINTRTRGGAWHRNLNSTLK
jgi:hypothetical protein